MTTMLESSCTVRGCKHYLGTDSPEDRNSMKIWYICEAYTEGIPDDIAMGKDKHLKVRPDQNNSIVYEKGKNIFEREGE